VSHKIARLVTLHILYEVISTPKSEEKETRKKNPRTNIEEKHPAKKTKSVNTPTGDKNVDDDVFNDNYLCIISHKLQPQTSLKNDTICFICTVLTNVMNGFISNTAVPSEVAVPI